MNTTQSTNQLSQGSSKILPVIAGAIVILLLAGYAIFSRRQPASVQEMAQVPTPASNVEGREEEVTQSEYVDGQYEAVGEYRSPGGDETIDVLLTLESGVVVDATVVSNATLPNSVQFQGMFVENFKEQVVGKNIDDLDLTHVSGSSLTPKGFNDAVEKIKRQARG